RRLASGLPSGRARRRSSRSSCSTGWSWPAPASLSDACSPPSSARRPAARCTGFVPAIRCRGWAPRHVCSASQLLPTSSPLCEPPGSSRRKPCAWNNAKQPNLDLRLSRDMSSDIRVGLRLLWKDKAFTLTAALTLALCIGANTALFSVVHNVLLRPLPVPESERIVRMGNADPGAGREAGVGGSPSVPDYYDRLRETDVFAEQAVYNGANQSIDQGGTPIRVRVSRVTPSFFRLLRAAPALGRVFSE